MKIRINRKYAEREPGLQQLADPAWFDRNGTTLHKGRNTIKRFETETGTELVVKRYGKPSLINRLVYGTLRRSKAMRAYLHAGRLLKLGVETPEMVAAIDIRRRLNTHGQGITPLHQAIYDHVREKVDFFEIDREIWPDIAQVEKMVRSGELLDIVRQDMPDFE